MGLGSGRGATLPSRQALGRARTDRGPSAPLLRDSRRGEIDIVDGAGVGDGTIFQRDTDDDLRSQRQAPAVPREKLARAEQPLRCRAGTGSLDATESTTVRARLRGMGTWARLRRRLQKRLALESYLSKCPDLLVSRYGLERTYPPPRTLTTLRVEELNLEFAEYACAMYASEAEFVAWATAEPPPHGACASDAADPYRSHSTPSSAPLGRRQAARRYASLRQEVAKHYNDGSFAFLPKPPPEYVSITNPRSPPTLHGAQFIGR
jgi:hypothetical protein